MVSNLQQEQKVSDAFSRQSMSFDQIYDNNPITLIMRERTRNEVLKYIQPGDKMLELNCGTGTDTIFFAQKGIDICATDNAEGMLEQLSAKVNTFGLQDRVSIRKCSFNDLSPLQGKGYNYIFSNFSGLNCTDELTSVLKQVNNLLLPGGYFTFVIMPVVCPWEMFMALRGRAKMAFRRFKKKGTKAHIEGVYFDCYYYNPSFIKKNIGNSYELCSLKGLASLMPPPFMDYFPVKYPRLFSALRRLDNNLCAVYPFNTWCDQYIITMRKGIVK